MKTRIAIVEDETVLREELGFQLAHMGFEVETFEDALQLYRRLAVQSFAVVVLDIGLSGEDGLSICRYLREHDRRLGLVFVTARALRDDRLTGLKAGADAYLTKPIDIDELKLILVRLAERSTSKADAYAPEDTDSLSVNSWHLEPKRSSLHTPRNQIVIVTLNEIRLLTALMRKPGNAVNNQELAKALALLPDEYNKHRVEVIISRLRDKVVRETGVTLPLMTRRGQGYVFQPVGHE